MRKWYKWQQCSIYGILLFLIFTSGNALEIYTNHFYVHIKHPGIENAHTIAKRHGFINRGPVSFPFDFIIFGNFKTKKKNLIILQNICNNKPVKRTYNNFVKFACQINCCS